MAERHTILTDWESTRLRGLNPYARLMYVFGYAERANFGTGVCSARFSSAAWWDILSFVIPTGGRRDWNAEYGLPDPKVSEGKFKEFIRARRTELVRAGLLEKRGSYDFYLCVYAKSEAKKAPFSRGLEPHVEHALNTPKMTPKPLNNKESETLEPHVEHALNTPLQYNNNNNTDFALFEDWQPSTKWAKSVGYAGFEITLEENPEGGDHIVTGKHRNLYYAARESLITYWLGDSTRAKEAKTQIGWQGYLMSSMRHLYKQHIADVRKANGGDPVKPQKHSGTKSGNELPKVANLIQKVPYQDDDLKAWQKRYAHMGAPKAKARADYSYSMWRADLTTWRLEAMQSEKYNQQRQAGAQ